MAVENEGRRIFCSQRLGRGASDVDLRVDRISLDPAQLFKSLELASTLEMDKRVGIGNRS